jgi:hypothetical protein
MGESSCPHGWAGRVGRTYWTRDGQKNISADPQRKMEDPWRAERHFWAHGVCTTRRRGRAEGGSGGAAWERRSRADGWRIDKAMASGWCGEARPASWRVDETGRGEAGQMDRWADGRGQVAWAGRSAGSGMAVGG